jgi:GAF domain-containing protein
LRFQSQGLYFRLGLRMDKTREALTSFSAGMLSADDVHSAVCEDILAHVCSTRASIWYFNDRASALSSACIVDRRSHVGEEQITLFSADYPAYFEAIVQEGLIRVSDARTHPATACLAEIYLIPNNIASLLDFAIKIGSDPVAILCCEHCGDVKEWSSQDQAYLQGMAILLRLFMVMQGVAKRRQVV